MCHDGFCHGFLFNEFKETGSGVLAAADHNAIKKAIIQAQVVVAIVNLYGEKSIFRHVVSDWSNILGENSLYYCKYMNAGKRKREREGGKKVAGTLVQGHNFNKCISKIATVFRLLKQ